MSKKTPKDNNISSEHNKPKDLKEKSSHARLLPKDTSSTKKLYWSFGFKFFHQIDLFGFSESDISWFVAVFGRLRELSQLEYVGITQVLEDGYRYHEINWQGKNVPLKRSDFNSLPKDYLDNETEYPFCQLHISKGTGRFVGFWDETNIFQVIVFDPLHNLQPSKFNNYEIRDCFPVKSQYDSLIQDIEEAKKLKCSDSTCVVSERLFKLPTGKNDSNVIIAYIDDEFYGKYKEIIANKTMTEILETGIVTLMA